MPSVTRSSGLAIENYNDSAEYETKLLATHHRSTTHLYENIQLAVLTLIVGAKKLLWYQVAQYRVSCTVTLL